MKKNLIHLAPAFLLALVLALGLRADEKPKEKTKTAEKAPKEMAYTATCAAPCEFSVKSHDKAEAAAMLKDHARVHHHQEMSDQDIDAAIKAHAIRKPKEQQ